MPGGPMQQELTTALGQAADRLRRAGLPAEAGQMEQLAGQVEQPCVVAVVGRVKAGKSTFINALLGEDLAKVGTTETTATINFFRYGPTDPDRPVRCHWRSGQITDESRSFLDGLQGNDAETLRRADGIHHLEYHLLNPYLERVTLVDTPGTGAVVTEHQDRTAEFMNLVQQLRTRHDQETQRLGNEADAIIYLIGETARVSEQAFLDEFQDATQAGARAFNAVGVMAKIDRHPDILARRTRLAATIAEQLQDTLNTVVPVSAGIRRALDSFLAADRARLRALMTALRSIRPSTLEKLLDDEEFYLELEPADCPVTPAERAALLGKLPWGVFTTIARLAGDSDLTEAAVVEQLEALAGFGQLKEVLDRHFFKRSQILRGYRIVNDARQVVSAVRFRQIPEFRRRAQADQARRERFLRFIQAAPGDPTVARDLESFVSEHLAPRADLDLDATVRTLDRELVQIYYALKEHNADFEALQELEAHLDLFTPTELEELRALLGLYGMETAKRLPAGRATVDYVEEQQQAWRQAGLLARQPARRAVAERVVTRYGLLLNELLGQTPGG